MKKRILLVLILLTLFSTTCYAKLELWKVTAYCSCKICCGKSDGITASGKKAKYGYVACNWLPFGTVVEIEGMGEFIVMDRGAQSLFGSKDNHIKHLDIWFPNHFQARWFGLQWKEVTIKEKK
jgi:3D (Asp-Asp-Asp) domain-containing protein